MKHTLSLISLILLCLFSLQACDQMAVVHEFQKGFPSNRWIPKEVKSFHFSLEKDLDNHSLTIQLGHIFDYQFDRIPLEICIYKPDGSKTTKTINITLNDKEGNQLSDCSGDVCDIYQNIQLKNDFFKKGNYKITISQKSNLPFLPNILGIGIQIKPIKN